MILNSFIDLRVLRMTTARVSEGNYLTKGIMYIIAWHVIVHIATVVDFKESISILAILYARVLKLIQYICGMYFWIIFENNPIYKSTNNIAPFLLHKTQ